MTGRRPGVKRPQASQNGKANERQRWIDNPRVRRGSTLTFGPEDCDVVVPNHDSLEEFHRCLVGLARLAGLPLKP